MTPPDKTWPLSLPQTLSPCFCDLNLAGARKRSCPWWMRCTTQGTLKTRSRDIRGVMMTLVFLSFLRMLSFFTLKPLYTHYWSHTTHYNSSMQRHLWLSWCPILRDRIRLPSMPSVNHFTCLKMLTLYCVLNCYTSMGTCLSFQLCPQSTLYVSDLSDPHEKRHKQYLAQEFWQDRRPHLSVVHHWTFALTVNPGPLLSTLH